MRVKPATGVPIRRATSQVTTIPRPTFYACAKCDGAEECSSRRHTSETQWRGKCATNLGKQIPAARSAAPFATENLASSATIRGEPRCVRRSALISSRRAGNGTTSGYGDFAPPDDRTASRL